MPTSHIFTYQTDTATCKHCGKEIIRLKDDPKGTWYHILKLLSGTRIIGKELCARTRAEPADGS